MCGITGIVNLDGAPAQKDVLEAMSLSTKHRGPDDSGVYISGPVGLAHNRLSIIDLSKDAHQPMASEDSSKVIVHNGEIYNYPELRAQLQRLDHRFRSRSDTEVILRAYEQWGESALKYFNGMWAFAIFDSKQKTLFCSRDRFGVKPFYYYSDDRVFIFSSEIKALLLHPRVKRQPNDRSVYSYLASGYGYMDITDETFFKGIKQLKPGHCIKLSVGNGKFSQTRYWDLDPAKRSSLKGEEDIYSEFYRLFEDSVRLRLRSDVPLGVSLSGGLDSSSIACVAARLLGDKKLEAFSSCFDEARYDERRFIQPVLDKTRANANLIFTRPENLFSEIEDIIWHQDEPYATLSIFPQWYVMKLAGEKGVKVLLTGQGGDETLAGYHKYYFYLFADLISSFKWQKAAHEIAAYRDFKKETSVAGSVLKIIASHMTPQAIKDAAGAGVKRPVPSFLNMDFAAQNSNRAASERKFNGILNNDLYNALKISPLPSLLHIDDRSSMAHSVESRAPFLDYRLVEYLFSLGPEYKIRDGITKYILRQSLKGVLPEEVRTRRDKMGFATPLESWFKTVLKGNVRDIITSKEFASRPYFNNAVVMEKFKNFTEGKNGVNHYTVWSWVNLELWLRKFIDKR